MTHQVAQTLGPDEPRTQVLMAVGAGALGRAGVVEMDHRQGPFAQRPVHHREQLIDGAWVFQIMPGAPQMGRVETHAQAAAIDAASLGRVQDEAQLLDGDTQAVALARGVLQHESRSRTARRRVLEHPPQGGCGPLHPRPDASAPMGPDVHVDGSRAHGGGRPQLLAHPLHAALVDRIIRGREVDQIRRVDQERHIPRGEELPEARHIRMGLVAGRPRLGVVGEHLDDAGAHRMRPLRHVGQPCPDGHVWPDPAYSERCTGGDRVDVHRVSEASPSSGVHGSPSCRARLDGPCPLPDDGRRCPRHPTPIPHRMTLAAATRSGRRCSTRSSSMAGWCACRRASASDRSYCAGSTTSDFEAGRDYAERDVDMKLALRHRDVAALRRSLVDGRYLSRFDGVYRVRPEADWPADPDADLVPPAPRPEV